MTLGDPGPPEPGRDPSRPRVLIGAYALNPELGSEEGVGWQWMLAVASWCEVTVLTACFHRDAIERAFAAEVGLSRLAIQVVYVPSRPWHFRPTPLWRRIEASPAKPLMNWAYRSWQWEAERVARRLHGERPFDLVHQLTYVGFRFPGGLWRLDAPFVWGPVGGLENTPWRLFSALDPLGWVYFGGRNLINGWQRRLLRAPRRAARRAGPGLIAATSGIAAEMVRRWHLRAEVIAEVTAPDLLVTTPPKRGSGDPLELVWSGAHSSGKALPLLFDALAGLPPEIDWRLSVLGSGPRSGAWQRHCARLGLASRCRWRGQLPRDAALAALGKAHILVVTSLKDLTSTVVVEGMATGLPVLCPRHCGFADAVDETCGATLPMDNPQRFVVALRGAIAELAADERRRLVLGHGALKRAKDYTAVAKATQIRAVYLRVLRRSPRCRNRLPGGSGTAAVRGLGSEIGV